jgi:hypothetical protein
MDFSPVFFHCHAREGGHPVNATVEVDTLPANAVITGSSAFADDDRRAWMMTV